MEARTPSSGGMRDSAVRYVANDDVLASPLGGEVVLLEPLRGVYFSLNEVGAFVWERLQDPVSLGDLCDGVVAHFEVDHETCEPDIREVLDDLLEHRLARTVESTES